jgi:EEF1A N-terminal glycine/lysine methyltransferase
VDTLDIFSSGLFSLYAELPATISSPNDTVSVKGITASPPETSSNNWGLQAHGVWQSAIYLAAHLHHLLPYLPDPMPAVENLDVLELGAGAGLPGLSLARQYAPRSVTLSDYPDRSILLTLRSNIARNAHFFAPHVLMRVVGHVWGDDSSVRLDSASEALTATELGSHDVIIAADVLWQSEQHLNLLRTLKSHLRTPDGVVFLVSGLHTGRSVIAGFLDKASSAGFTIRMVCEARLVQEGRYVEDEETVEFRREFSLEIAGETRADRSLWVVEIVLGYPHSQDIPGSI